LVPPEQSVQFVGRQSASETSLADSLSSLDVCGAQSFVYAPPMLARVTVLFIR
jgi:hypothetical protein